MPHGPVVSCGQRYIMHHLQPHRHSLAGQGRAGADLVVRISYRSHVYSVTPDELSPNARFPDEHGRARQFCPVRYRASLQLPRLCCELIDRNQPTWPSRDRNGMSSLAVCESIHGGGLKYLIFFRVFPSAVAGLDVEMEIKSAYDAAHDPSHVKRVGLRQVLKRCHFQNVEIP